MQVEDGEKVCLACVVIVLLFLSGVLYFSPEQEVTTEATTKTPDQPFEVIDLGWRDVKYYNGIPNSRQQVFWFGITSALNDRSNIRAAVTDMGCPPSTDSFRPLVSRDWKKIYVLEIRQNPIWIPNGSIYVVKMGNLSAELAKAGLPR